MSSVPAIDSLQAYREAQQRIATQLPGGAPWRTLRAEALERLMQLGWPTARDESWKYVPLRLFEKRVFEAALPEPRPIDASALAQQTLKLAGARRLVFVNGALVPALSSAPVNEPGVSVATLGAELAREPERLRTRLPAPGDHADERLRLLNLAFLADGAEVRIEAGTAPAPIYLQFVASGQQRASHPRILIELEAGARASIIEHHVSLAGAETLTNGVTDIRLGRSAQLEYLTLAEPGPRSLVFSSAHALQDAESRLQLHRVLFGGLLNRFSLQAALDGRGATLDTNALLFASGHGHAEAHSVIRHRAANTRSAERFRGVAGERGRGVFNGRIVVEPDAARSESQQSSRSLLLSESAEIDSRPQLEILHHDVKCSHGATTGQLDPDMLFYLLSRGLDPRTARALLIYAFLDDVLARVGLTELRQQLERRISSALPDPQRIEEFL